jgi:protein required for attachment to host cells
MSRIRVVVADQAEAIFYDLSSLKARPVEVGRLTDPTARRASRVPGSERSLSPAQGSSSRTNAEDMHTLRRELASRFAHVIAERLDADRRERAFQQLIVVASAPFRSVLRAQLSDATQACIVYEVPKDLVHSHVEVLLDYLPDRAQELRSA